MVSFPFVICIIVFIWFALAVGYLVTRWRQRSRSVYIIPRVFVLCSPRTVQFHYELILRIGLASSDFNPDKHDIDITVHGQLKNEVVPMTRLNTRTLMDEPLITSLSIIAYRLVEMPPLGGLLLKHSGSYKSSVYCYDFTTIDLTTNKEYYYVINQYIGSLERFIPLGEPNKDVEVKYPIDDVPLPQWSSEDIFIFLYIVINAVMLTVTLMPINCNYLYDIVSVLLVAFGSGCLVFFLDWLFYFNIAWNRDRREYFNQMDSFWLFSNEYFIRILMGSIATATGGLCIFYSVTITDWAGSVVWMLASINSCSLVIGIWNVARQIELGEGIIGLGLRLRGIETVAVGMRYSELISNLQRSKSTSFDEEGSNISNASRIGARSFGPRSSVKTFGFETTPPKPKSISARKR